MTLFTPPQSGAKTVMLSKDKRFLRVWLPGWSNTSLLYLSWKSLWLRSKFHARFTEISMANLLTSSSCCTCKMTEDTPIKETSLLTKTASTFSSETTLTEVRWVLRLSLCSLLSKFDSQKKSGYWEVTTSLLTSLANMDSTRKLTEDIARNSISLSSLASTTCPQPLSLSRICSACMEVSLKTCPLMMWTTFQNHKKCQSLDCKPNYFGTIQKEKYQPSLEAREVPEESLEPSLWTSSLPNTI